MPRHKAQPRGGTSVNQRIIKATVCGSFRRAMAEVTGAVYELTDSGVQVLSPADPRVVGQFGDFLFVASDRMRAIKLVESRHLAAIKASDFVWLVAPDGYVGQSGAMEMGFALAVGTPVFCSEVPTDLTLRQYVTVLDGPQSAISAIRRRCPNKRRSAITDVLLDPVGVLESAHDDLDRIAGELTDQSQAAGLAAAESADRLHRAVVLPLQSH